MYGDITPSGKLTDTIAHQYTDYPSASTFNTSPLFVNYAEDIFVGYRCIVPYIDKSGILTSAKGGYKTTFDEISVEWETDGNTAKMRISVPKDIKYNINLPNAKILSKDGEEYILTFIN